MAGTLSDDAVQQALAGLPGWERAGDTIRKQFRHPSFADAIAFVVRIAFLAEAADHHPDLDVRWRTVHVSLTTHAAGGLTARDLDLAREIETATGSG